MQGRFDTARLSQINTPEPIIQRGDLVSIVLYSDNPVATAIYNQPLIITQGNAGTAASATGSTGGITPTAPGYLVDEQGNIELQSVGLFHVESMTRKQLADSLVKYFIKNDLLTHPYVNIRFLNYKISMLGEVNHPGIFSIPGDHVNLLEAIGLAGDLSAFARRDSILIIRESNGRRSFARLDITKPEIIASPYYYLQQNDMVIVEQIPKKAREQDALATQRNVSVAATVVSALGILYSIFRR